MHDVVVIGGGVAGTLAVVAAASRGLDVAWISDPVDAGAQSAHWHGHLHRGRLYDSVREADLIHELSQNVGFWWSDAVVRFHTDVDTIAVGPDERWATDFRRRLGGVPRDPADQPFLRHDVHAMLTDEAILDGPAFLGAATEAAASASTRVAGHCSELRQQAGGAWEASWTAGEAGCGRVRARTVILAGGTRSPELVPSSVRLDRGLDARLSRMLVLRGDLPRAAAIMPSRSAGGLFFASRELPSSGRRAGERVWLVSDGFSSRGVSSPGPLTDGWWACSVIERLADCIREDVLEGVTVSAYHAAKSRLRSSPAQVPADGYAIDRDRSFVALTPSKWSTAPTSAALALSALLPDPVPASARTVAMAEALLAAAAPARAPFLETWQTLGVGVPLAALREPGLAALTAAAGLFRQDADPVGLPTPAARPEPAMERVA
jgi:glycine/D-amino acid oxidase-like deaminating enzyme